MRDLRLERIETNHQRLLAIGSDEAHPAIGDAVLLSQEGVDAWMRPGDGVGAIPTRASASHQFDDGISREPLRPRVTGAVEPRRASVVHHPEARFLPAAARKWGSQRDHLAPDLDQRHMGSHDEKPGDSDCRDCGEQSTQPRFVRPTARAQRVRRRAEPPFPAQGLRTRTKLCPVSFGRMLGGMFLEVPPPRALESRCRSRFDVVLERKRGRWIEVDEALDQGEETLDLSCTPRRPHAVVEG